jgi:hypothetical protein
MTAPQIAAQSPNDNSNIPRGNAISPSALAWPSAWGEEDGSGWAPADQSWRAGRDIIDPKVTGHILSDALKHARLLIERGYTLEDVAETSGSRRDDLHRGLENGHRD